jgi:hypothetical protein
VQNVRKERIAAIADTFAELRVTSLHDTDGEAGANQIFWDIEQRGSQVQHGWSRTMLDGKYADRQPDSLANYVSLRRCGRFALQTGFDCARRSRSFQRESNTHLLPQVG